MKPSQDVESRFVRRTACPSLGPLCHIATPLRFSRDAFQPFRTPRMGEHVDEVARTLCGMTPERIAEFEIAGVFQ